MGRSEEEKYEIYQVSFQLLVQQCSQLRGSLISHFFTAVHIYNFHLFPVIIHHSEGLFESNFMTSSQLACQLSWYSAAPVSQRSWVQIPYGPEFFSGLISTTSSVVFIASRIVYISFLHRSTHIGFSYINSDQNNISFNYYPLSIVY